VTRENITEESIWCGKAACLMGVGGKQRACVQLPIFTSRAFPK
jgi:hypothetical protein